MAWRSGVMTRAKSSKGVSSTNFLLRSIPLDSTDSHWHVYLSVVSDGCSYRETAKTFGLLPSQVERIVVKIDGLLGVQIRENLLTPGHLGQFFFNDDLRSLHLSTRSYNALIRGGVESVSDLCNRTTESIYRMQSLGETCFNDILSALDFYGLSLKEEPSTVDNIVTHG